MTGTRANEHQRFARGVAEFNQRHFYEAHEIWESIWVDEVGDRRLCLQALVQIAAGYHKAEIGVPGGAKKLWTSALRILDERSDCFGIDVSQLRQAVRDALAAPPGSQVPPTLKVLD